MSYSSSRFFFKASSPCLRCASLLINLLSVSLSPVNRSDNNLVTGVCTILIALSLWPGTPTLTVGDVTNNTRLVTNDELDLATVGTYAIQPTYQYTTGTDAVINAYFNVAGATQGSAKILVSYM